MAPHAASCPIDHEYRSIISDNQRWHAFTPRPGDIFVCTPAKCGTTWMQTIVTALLFPDGAPGPVFEIAPWLDARFEPLDDVIGRLDAQTHRRQIKTHTNADGIPWYPTASYIVVGRDGRDAFMSFLNHMRNMRPDVVRLLAGTAVDDGIDLGGGGPPPIDDVHEFFRYWIDEAMWFRHVASFWAHKGEPNVCFVHFNDMKSDLDAQMRRVAAFLGIAIDETKWPAQVESCTFAAMKHRSTEIGDFDAHFQGGADSFLYKGTNGRWGDVLTDDELATFDRRLHELVRADAIAWTMARA